MTMKTTRLLALLLSVLMLSPSAVFPCAPMFPTAVFTVTSRPDNRDQLLRGNLGILHDTYRSYDLVVAYRYLAGIGLDREAQQALADKPCDNEEQVVAADWVKNWLDARKQVTGVTEAPIIGWHAAGTGISRTETEQEYYSFVNCGEDAFRTAVRTLTERMQVYGKEGPELIDWVKAQDIVFSNCEKGRTVPDPASPAAPPAVKSDRAYQTAAAHFYSFELEKAEQEFLAIAGDNSSPWSVVAPYLAARTQVRMATMKGGPGKTDPALLSRAETTLEAIVRNDRLKPYHQAAADLLSYVKTRLRPAERMHELAVEITKKDVGRALDAYLQDYRYMLKSIDPEAKKAAIADDDVTDWVLTFQNARPDAAEHAVQLWEKTSSQPWLIAAIAKMKAGHPKQQKLQAEADKIKPASPAYQTAVYHSLRLSIETGNNNDAARRRLDTLLAQNDIFTGTSRNLLLALRMRVSRNLNELLKFAVRVPATVGYGYDDMIEYTDDKVEQEYGKKQLLDKDSVAVLNALPLSLMITAATGTILPEDARKQLAFASLIRSFLLDNEQAVKRLTPVLSTFVPEMQHLFAAFNTATNKEERRFLATYIAMKYPIMKPYIISGIGRITPEDKIDSYRDNWWCALGKEEGQPGRYQDRYKFVQVGKESAIFLTPEQVNEAQRERLSLGKVETAPNYFAAIVLPWAEAHRDDPRVPEALHLLVRATRYGCEDKETHGHSKAAFKLLHKRYPSSNWAKETPYYF